jgi:hypothetical protein
LYWLQLQKKLDPRGRSAYMSTLVRRFVTLRKSVAAASCTVMIGTPGTCRRPVAATSSRRRPVLYPLSHSERKSAAKKSWSVWVEVGLKALARPFNLLYESCGWRRHAAAAPPGRMGSADLRISGGGRSHGRAEAKQTTAHGSNARLSLSAPGLFLCGRIYTPGKWKRCGADTLPPYYRPTDSQRPGYGRGWPAEEPSAKKTKKTEKLDQR